MCDSMNHTRFPKEDHTPDWVCREKHGNKGDRVVNVAYIKKKSNYPGFSAYPDGSSQLIWISEVRLYFNKERHISI